MAGLSDESEDKLEELLRLLFYGHIEVQCSFLFYGHIEVQCSFVQCCFASTETVRTIRDVDPRTSTSSFTQLLNSEHSSSR